VDERPITKPAKALEEVDLLRHQTNTNRMDATIVSRAPMRS